jgi:phosphatidylinositol alpha-1,6-mannosyltransferase
MKILIYTHEFPPFLGGLATTSYKLSKGIGSSSFEAVVLAPGYSSKDKTVDESLPCKVIRVPGLGVKWVKKVPFVGTILAWIYLFKTVITEKPDSVLFITEEAEVVGGLLPTFNFKAIVRIAGSGITTCFYGEKFFKRILQYPMMRLYNHARMIIAVSNNTKELVQSIGVPEEKTEVVYNGVEDYMLSRDPDEELMNRLRSKFGIEEDDKVLVTIARVLPRKGQDTVIKALPEVLKEIPNLKYLIVGEGRYRQNFSELSQEIGVSDAVIFTGGVAHDETINFFDLSDVFIMPNRYWNNKIEGLPNSLIEASARSKPLIAGNHGGSKEAVQHNISGLLVDPESVKDVAQAIITILKDENLALSMGSSGRENILKNHTEEGMIANYISAIEKASQ